MPSVSAPARDPRYVLGLGLVLLACAVVYVRGLFGGFLFDDFGAIVDNPALRNIDGSITRWLAAALSSDSGWLRRPISMLSFGLDTLLFGVDPLPFKINNLIVHLVNGLLLYALAKRLIPRLGVVGDASRIRLVALVAMALWLLHPLNVGSVTYVVQRMNLLAVMFMLAGLICYASGRERMLRGEPGFVPAFGGIALFGLLAVLSKENGALITAFALVVEAVCFRFDAPAARMRNTIKAFFVVTVLLPVVAFLAWTLIHPAWIQHAYAGRDFTLVERLLTEPRILCDYLLWIVVPLPRWMGVYHDDIVTSTALFSPPATAIAIAFLAGLVVAAWRLRLRYPGFSFAVAWFLVGHSMESTIIPLELAFDHRNYLPMAGLILGIVCTIATWLQARAIPARFGMLAAVAIAAVFAATTATWAYAWGDPLRLALAEARDHPDSPRAQYEAGRRIIFEADAKGDRESGEKAALPYFERAVKLDSIDMFAAAALLRIRAAQDGHVSNELVDDLARRAKAMKIPHVNPLLATLTAATVRTLPLTDEQTSKLVYAALDNPAYPPTMRAMLLSDYGHFKFQVVHDNQSAVALTLAAAAEDPTNPLFEINLVKLALAIGDMPQATAHLAAAEKLNKVGLYDTQIAELRQKMSAAQPSAPE